MVGKMNVLILGAGLMQKPAILASKELGYKTFVIDADKDAVSIPYADEFCQIDLKDKEKILDFARKLQLDGGLKAVFTAGTDFSASVSYVCEKLNLNAHSYEAALNASIKTRMRTCFKNSNVPSPEFVKISAEDLKNGNLIHEILQKMSFPFVVKPVDNMGGRGCRLVRSEIEFLPAVKNATESSRSGFAIVEEYMEGPEFSIDAVVTNGKFIVTGFAERHIFYPPYFIEMGHTMPAVLNKKMHDELISCFACGAKSLGLTEGVAKADIKYTKKGPMIGEIAARLSGGYMSGWTYPYSSDLNLTREALKVACSENPDVLEKRRISVDFVSLNGLQKPYELYEVLSLRTSAERAWISIPGKVKYIENITDYTDQAVRDFLPRATVSPGCSVDFPRNNVQKCGNVISVSASREIAVEAAQDGVSNVFITLEAHNDATENFLKAISLPDEEKFPPDAFAISNKMLLEKLSGTILENKKTEDFIPDFLKSKENSKLTDWNYNTILQTARKFDILRPVHKSLDSKIFWKAVIRGGIQAAVYICDCQD